VRANDAINEQPTGPAAVPTWTSGSGYTSTSTSTTTSGGGGGTTTSTTTTSAGSGSGTGTPVAHWGQCGGTGYSGSTAVSSLLVLYPSSRRRLRQPQLTIHLVRLTVYMHSCEFLLLAMFVSEVCWMKEGSVDKQSGGKADLYILHTHRTQSLNRMHGSISEFCIMPCLQTKQEQ
jgi:hypothetical protein